MRLTYAFPVLGVLTLFAGLPSEAKAGGHSSWGISVGFGYSDYGHGGGYNTGIGFSYSSGSAGYYGNRYYGGHGYHAPGYVSYAPAPDVYYRPAPRYVYSNNCRYNYAPVYYRPVYSPRYCYRY